LASDLGINVEPVEPGLPPERVTAEMSPDVDDAEGEDWHRTARNTDRRSYLDAVDSQRRRLRLKLTSEGLLRKPATKQGARMRLRAAGLREQAQEQMRAGGRRPFRGEVAVDLDLHAVGVEQPAASPPTVKAYLDLLQGIAYGDDRAVRYLRVTRHASDNPLFRRVPGDWIYGPTPRFPHGPKTHVEVRIKIQPLRTYVADANRLFLLRDHVFGEDADGDADGVEFFDNRFAHMEDDDLLDELRDEHQEDLEGRGLFAPGEFYDRDPELRAELRSWRETRLRALRRKLLLDGAPDELDRPGPPSPMTRLLWREEPDIERWQTEELLGPGRFILPLPPDEPRRRSWRDEVRDAMSGHRSKWRTLDAVRGTPLALDIAVRGTAGARNVRDLDNLAHDVLGPFEEIFCADERGSVPSYRVYTAETGPPGVRLLVYGDDRLAAFERAITTSRFWLLTRGPRYRDD
jgi:hypothetical protein